MKTGSYHHPSSKVAVPPARSVDPVADVPIVVTIEVPLVREIPPRGGLVTVALGAAGFVGFVGSGLVLQDLRDNPAVRLGGDEDLREDQRARRSSSLFAFVFPDASGLGSGRGGAWWWWGR